MELFMDESSSDCSLLECFLTSSSSSSSDCDEPHQKRSSIENFMDVVDNYTNVEFKSHFRLTRSAVSILVDKFVDNSKGKGVGREQIDPRKEIYITLWYMANTETYRQISDRFNVTKSSVWRVLHKVINWIVEPSQEYIKWPNEEEMRSNQVKFANSKGFPRVVGAIDGCHIRIKCPKTNREAYYNRKKYYSILLQGTVDAEKKFIDVHCGEPGSMHDARMFRRSALYRGLTENQNLLIPGAVLLGDSAYPDSNFLVTPFKDFGNLSAKKIKFNYLHSATRIVVENAYGLLKSRFRRLRVFQSPSIGFISNCVVAACVLHNICIDEGQTDDIFLSEPSQDFFTTMDDEIDSTTAKMNIYRELDNNNFLN